MREIRIVTLVLALVAGILISACGSTWDSAHKTCVVTFKLSYDQCTEMVRDFQRAGCEPEAMEVALATRDSSEAAKHCPWAGM